MVVAISLSACGGSSAPAKKAASKVGSGRSNSMLAMAKCMRANGVPNFPDPSAGGGGIQVNQSPNGSMTVNGVAVNAPSFQRATNKCQSKLPQGAPTSAAQIAKIRAGALKMANCMRSHGVTNFQDPVVKAGPGGRGIEMSVGSPGLDQQSPAFEKAQQICGSFMGRPIGLATSGTHSSGRTPKSTASGS
jgi:hypothetical protein